jgi:GT2 family glycosyltransferase
LNQAWRRSLAELLKKPYRLPGKCWRLATRTINTLFKPEVSQRKIRRFARSAKKADMGTISCPQDPSIAIVVPCFGHAAYIADMFSSVVNQTHRPDQVIFVVDSSPDDSRRLLVALIEDLDPPFRGAFEVLENTVNIGQAASLNRGIESARADLIVVLNDDDYLMHDYVETILRILKRYPRAAMVGGHSLHFAGDGLKELPKSIAAVTGGEEIAIDYRVPHDVKKYRICNDINMTHSGSCFLRAAWEAVGGYYPDRPTRIVHFSDRDFQIRMNALFPVALSNTVPLSLWRSDSSIDSLLDS